MNIKERILKCLHDCFYDYDGDFIFSVIDEDGFDTYFVELYHKYLGQTYEFNVRETPEGTFEMDDSDYYWCELNTANLFTYMWFKEAHYKDFYNKGE